MSPFEKEQRRAKRFDVKIPLLLTSLTTEDTMTNAPGVAESVSRTGLRLHCWHGLRNGMFVRLGRPDGKETKLARVIWARPGEGGQVLAGLALSMALRDPGDFWGIDYPKADQPETMFWKEELPSGEEEEEEAEEAQAAVAVEETVPVRIPAAGVPVLVRGVSTSRTPFQEETELRPKGNDEAVITVSWVLDEGHLLHIVLFDQERVVRARVTGYGRKLPLGKHRIWVEFEQPTEILGEIPPGDEEEDLEESDEGSGD